MVSIEQSFSLDHSLVHKTPAAKEVRSASMDVAGIDVR